MISVTIIRIIHLLIVIFIVAAVFIPNCFVKEIGLTILLFLLLQYLLGFEKCGLTDLEYLLLGEDHYQEGFIYRIINPMIKVPEKYFYNGLFYLHILWILILGYQIYRNRCHFKTIKF